MKVFRLFLLPSVVLLLQVGLDAVSGTVLGNEQPQRTLRVGHVFRVDKSGKKLVDATNASAICGLPLLSKGSHKSVLTGGKYKVMTKLTNNVNAVFGDVVVKVVLPQGATFLKAATFPNGRDSQMASVEVQGTEVVWRQVQMKPKQSRYFKVMIKIDCLVSTPLNFRSYTTVGGTGWITGPEVQVNVKSSRNHKKQCLAIPVGPTNVTEFVTSLSDKRDPPSGTWTTGIGSIQSEQNVTQLPSSRRRLSPGSTATRELTASGYPSALRQQTFGNISRATAGVYFDPYGICNGLLFKNFVLEGFQLYYEYFVDSTPAGEENVYAPNLVLQTRSPATGEVSNFVWDPAVNGQTQYQQWKTSFMVQSTGSDDPWPVGPSGGTGWGCTQGCYLPANSTGNPDPTFRSLETYVQELLSFSTCSSTYCAISDAIITGIQVVLGVNEPDTVAFTRKVGFSAGDCTREWIFGSP